MLFILLAVAVIIAVLAGAHWYMWRRLVRDVTARASRVRRLGTTAAIVLPLLSLGALGAGQAGAPFRLQRALAWLDLFSQVRRGSRRTSENACLPVCGR